MYNDICCLMSLSYEGLSSDLMNVVGRDTFLEALGDPVLCIRILDKVPATMEEALWIALNLEILDRSRDTETKALTDCVELWARQTRRKKSTLGSWCNWAPFLLTLRHACQHRRLCLQMTPFAT